MDSERPIEKTLRAVAGKLRARPGAAVPLHPATRKMLVNEGLRAFPPAAASISKSSPWSALSWAVATAFGIAMAMFFMFPRPQPPREVALVARYSGSRSESAAAGAEKPSDKRSAGALQDGLDSRAGLSAGKDVSAKSAAGNRELIAGGNQKIYRDRNKEPLSDSVAPAPAGAADLATLSTFFAATNSLLAAETFHWKFARKETARSVTRASTVQAPTPLQRFELKKNGENVEVLDSDGSVYTGKLLTHEREAGSKLKTETSQAELKAEQSSLAKDSGYSFTVTGTNRSSGEWLEFRGTMTAAVLAESWRTGIALNDGAGVASQKSSAVNGPKPTSTHTILGQVASQKRTNTIEAIQVP
jgi:hypothetical protein